MKLPRVVASQNADFRASLIGYYWRMLLVADQAGIT